MPNLPPFPFGVEPKIGRLANGLLALTGGRPGIWLWIAEEENLDAGWAPWDLTAHHNRASPADSAHRYNATQFALDYSLPHPAVTQTTSYTGMVIQGDTLVLSYDWLDAYHCPHTICAHASAVFSVRVSIDRLKTTDEKLTRRPSAAPGPTGNLRWMSFYNFWDNPAYKWNLTAAAAWINLPTVDVVAVEIQTWAKLWNAGHRQDILWNVEGSGIFTCERRLSRFRDTHCSRIALTKRKRVWPLGPCNLVACDTVARSGLAPDWRRRLGAAMDLIADLDNYSNESSRVTKGETHHHCWLPGCIRPRVPAMIVRTGFFLGCAAAPLLRCRGSLLKLEVSL